MPDLVAGDSNNIQPGKLSEIKIDFEQEESTQEIM